MKEVIEFLQENDLQYFATIGVDGTPKVRPFQFMLEEDGKLWFCTSNQKRIYTELAHPHVELCVSGENMSWLRLGGQVVFSDRLEVKEKIFNLSSIVRDVYKSKDNPEFVIFYLKEISASISSFVEPVKIFNQ